MAAAASGTVELQGNAVRPSQPETDKIWTVMTVDEAVF
jgi:hypothetical protein